MADAGCPVNGFKLGALGAVALVAGCDKNCQNTCFKIVDENECGVVIGSINENELKDNCIEDCEAALSNAGSMGIYDPYVGDRPDQPNEITNEKMAAAWMDCVAETSCEDLQPPGNSCNPIDGG